MILILIFAEAIGLYGLIIAIVLSQWFRHVLDSELHNNLTQIISILYIHLIYQS
jgi:hypothetical protein